MTTLPARRVSCLDTQPEEHRWLIEHLWADQAIGVLGGEPKVGKSFCALDVAVSVASGARCLGRFVPAQTGRVLLYAAEDALHVVRQRIKGICRIAGVDFQQLDVQVITAPSVRLNLDADRTALSATIAVHKPRLLILDPFVRLHRVDENAVSEVAPLLAYLRHLQRQYACAVLLVHHARKGAGNARGGQALRGSSELHAIGDSNIYLRRKNGQLLLSIEHRAAPSVENIPLALQIDASAVALRVIDNDTDTVYSPPLQDNLPHRILAALDKAGPQTPRQLRATCRVRMANVYQALRLLAANGSVIHDRRIYKLA